MIVIVLVIVFGIFAAASMMQSYASARQAEAQIATAHAAQISATGNLISIVSNMLVLLAVIILVSAVVFYFYKKSLRAHRPSSPDRDLIPFPDVQNPNESPQFNSAKIMKLLEMQMMMRMIDKMNGSQDNSLPALTDQQLRDELLRRSR